ncbi:hypothetical protein GXD30_23885 [Escherichia coli]|nr:hypothetical protein [Escherichia coli]
MKINARTSQWPVTFFATSFGAGIFFLPQTIGPKAIGSTSTIVLLILSALISLSGQFLFYKFILATDKKDYVTSAKLLIGNKAANIISVAFILSMLLIAIINITTTINVVCQFLSITERIYASIIISMILIIFFIIFNSKIERLTSGIAFPALLIVFLLSIYFYSQPSIPSTIKPIEQDTFNLLILFPIVLFSFNFSPCIQRFAQCSNTTNSLKAFITGIFLILVFITFIVFSLNNIFSPLDIKEIRDTNSDALSYSANVTQNGIIAFISIITMILITSGAYTGTLTGIVDTAASLGLKNKLFTAILVSIITCISGAANFEIVKVIAALSTPIIAITVFIIPSIFFLQKKNTSILKKSLLIMNLIIGVGICAIPAFL